MKAETKLALRRWALRQARYLFDAIEERLHAAEVRLREELAKARGARAMGSIPELPCNSQRPASLASQGCPSPNRITDHESRVTESFAQWEARRSGFASLPQKPARRRGMPARAFDLRFSTR